MQNFWHFPGTSAWLSILFVFFTITVGQASAQGTSARAYTWDDLKAVQTAERTELVNTQKETLRQVLEVEKEQLNAMRNESTANANDLLQLAAKFKEERVELARVHAEERAKLASVQAQERKDFQQAQNSLGAKKNDQPD